MFNVIGSDIQNAHDWKLRSWHWNTNDSVEDEDSELVMIQKVGKGVAENW